MTPSRIVVTGSVAFDYLMTFPGKFLDVVVPDRMSRLSVSFLVDSMRRVRGGVAPNIAYGLALFGLKPVIMATAGVDALDYARWLAEEGVDTSELHISDDLFTASFFVSTDEVQNQIATFYTGAMARAVNLSFRAFGPGTVSLAVIAPNAPEAMIKYAEECRTLRIPFVFDPSQQVARLGGAEILSGLEGAAILVANEYEFGVIEKKTGLSEAEVLSRVPVLIVTRGEQGSTIALRGGSADAPDGAVVHEHSAREAPRRRGRPDRRRRRVPRGAPRGTPARTAVGRGGPGRERRRRLRPGDDRGPAATLRDRRTSSTATARTTGATASHATVDRLRAGA